MPQSGQERRRRINWPSSASRESTTRESGKRQYGQRTREPSLYTLGVGRRTPRATPPTYRRTTGAAGVPPRPATARAALTHRPRVGTAGTGHSRRQPQVIGKLHTCNYYMLGVTLFRRPTAAQADTRSRGARNPGLCRTGV
ncbi:hypothetical protein GCM10010123_04420 [Pilimelia anulata]|uniref:Uncharacterized protein n=1 Tax=Pilimelia anulata TaxID=53371 RepID=A0A8J3FAT7_9ACTN|nr:hypothetical protein GCM10010123_04420 [Pilimelia anulata]